MNLVCIELAVAIVSQFLNNIIYFIKIKLANSSRTRSMEACSTQMISY